MPIFTEQLISHPQDPCKVYEYSIDSKMVSREVYYEEYNKMAQKMHDYTELTYRIYKDGTTQYTDKMGDLHREDGPALKIKNGPPCWFLNGVQFRTAEAWQAAVDCRNKKPDSCHNKEVVIDGKTYKLILVNK